MNNADLGTSTGEVDPQLMRSIIRLCSMEPCSKRGVLLCQWKNAGGVLHHTGNYSDQNAFLQVQTFIYLGGGASVLSAQICKKVFNQLAATLYRLHSGSFRQGHWKDI